MMFTTDKHTAGRLLVIYSWEISCDISRLHMFTTDNTQLGGYL